VSTFHAEYVLPLRWEKAFEHPDMTAYLLTIARIVDVTVVDGSQPSIFDAHHCAWSDVRHIRPRWPGTNGKACGAMTGIADSRHDIVVIADDDVRYECSSLQEIISRLDDVDMVRPQNYFDPRPWHARWDTGRTLLNRATGGDYCGTVAIRRSTLMRRGGYRTDVLFENLELERTIRAADGTVDVAHDLYVRRRPPQPDRFFEQRVRQAYDELARPVRLTVQLALLPAILVAARAGRKGLGAAVALIIALAEIGRRRAGGARIFPPTAALWAPAWVGERAITSWIAVAHWLRGGVRYRQARIRQAASSMRQLRRTT
jgi:hypothetical protein